MSTKAPLSYSFEQGLFVLVCSQLAVLFVGVGSLLASMDGLLVEYLLGLLIAMIVIVGVVLL
jgi:hypothetical protein